MYRGPLSKTKKNSWTRAGGDDRNKRQFNDTKLILCSNMSSITVNIDNIEFLC